MFAKKNLIALAALATLAVSAQAQSSVTVYGNVDVGLSSTKEKAAGNSSTTNGVTSSILTESFFGLKGQEDLGGGLKAVFKLESGINVDTGAAASATNFFGKNAYVGVAGDFGTVTLGNQESLFKTEAGAFDAFGFSPALAGSSRILSVFSAVDDNEALSGVGLGGSWANSVGYTSANINGLTVSAQYSAKEGADYGGAYAVAANYASGALGLSAVYGQTKNVLSSTLPVPAFVPEETKSRALLLGASYDFGVAKAFAQYGQNKVSVEGQPGSATPKFYNIGAIAPVTQAGAVHVSYGQLKNSDAGNDFKARTFSLAYHHTLSKRSSVYVGGVYEKADDNGADTKRTTLAVGVRHAF